MSLSQATFPNTFEAIEKASDKSLVKRALALSGIQGLSSNGNSVAMKATVANSPEQQFSQAQQISAIMATKAALQPFEDAAVAAEDKDKESAKAAHKEAFEAARAKLLEVDVQLPPGVDVNNLSNHLSQQMQVLTIKRDAKPDLDPKKLVDRLGLMRCVRLRPGGADIASGNVGHLKLDKDPFKQPLGVSFAYEDREIVENSRHAETTKLESTVGNSLAASASTKGAGFYSGAVGAWSASMSLAGASEKKSASTNAGSSSYSTHVKTTEVIQKSSQFSLAESDFELNPEFEQSLRRLLKPIEGCETKQIAIESSRIFEEFGTHLATQALIGGKFSIKCTIRVEKEDGKVKDQDSVAAALNFKASGAIAAACPFGGGTASAAMEASAKVNIARSTVMANDKYLSMTQTNQYVTGGDSGNLSSWLTSMASNHSWEVLDREADNGFRCATSPGCPETVHSRSLALCTYSS